MTEEQARQKWCPMTRALRGRMESTPWGSVALSRAGVNVWISDEKEVRTKCISSDCMMWRFTGAKFVNRDSTVSPDGVCGLAGRDLA
jgi:hypothetical protein